MRYLITLSLLFMTSGCLTWAENPGKFRAQHPHTLGGSVAADKGSLSYMHHAGEHLGLAVNFEKEEPNATRIHLGRSTSSINTDNPPSSDERDVYQASLAFSGTSIVFPWDTSSFMIGVHLERRMAQLAYSEHTTEFSLDQSTTNVEWSDHSTNVGIPIGFSKNATNGLTVMGAISPTTRIKAVRSYQDDGESDLVDSAKRDDTIATISDVQQTELRLVTMIGYAF